MKDLFKEKVAVITGAGSGIGRAVALALAKQGCHLSLCDKHQANLEQTEEMLLQYDTRVMRHALDVTNKDAFSEFANQVKSEFQKVDILINSAGVTIAAKPFSDITIEEWKWIMDINLWGTIYCMQAFLPLMINKGSTVVNMSSMLGLVGMTNQSAYSTTKFAIRGLTESLRMELKDSGIHFVAVHPGAVETNFIDNSWADEENKALIKSYIKKMGSVSAVETADKILKAIINRKGRVVIGKDAKSIDWLSRLMPTKYTDIILSRIRKKLQ